MKDRRTCLFRGRLAQFSHRADEKDVWSERWQTADLSNTYKWAERGALGVYRRSFLRYLPKDGLIIEAGCGTGRYVRALIEHGYNVVGVEWDFQIVKRIKNIWTDAPLVCSDVHHFPFPDQSAKSVVSLGVIEHFEHPWHVLVDTFRILKPGGILYLVVPYENALRHFLSIQNKYPKCNDARKFYQYLLSDAEIRSSLHMMGFSVKTSFATNALSGMIIDFPNIGKFIRKLPFSNRIINGLNKVRMLGNITGHVVHYVAEKRVNY